MRLTPQQVVGMTLMEAGLDNIGMKVPAVAEAIFDALDQNGYEITNKARPVPGVPVTVGKRTNPLKTARELADNYARRPRSADYTHEERMRCINQTGLDPAIDDDNGGFA